jgi:hypothetical protein
MAGTSNIRPRMGYLRQANPSFKSGSSQHWLNNATKGLSLRMLAIWRMDPRLSIFLMEHRNTPWTLIKQPGCCSRKQQPPMLPSHPARLLHMSLRRTSRISGKRHGSIQNHLIAGSILDTISLPFTVRTSLSYTRLNYSYAQGTGAVSAMGEGSDGSP